MHYHFGSAYVQQDRLDKAILAFERFLELSPSAEWRAMAEQQLKELKGE